MVSVLDVDPVFVVRESRASDIEDVVDDVIDVHLVVGTAIPNKVRLVVDQQRHLEERGHAHEVSVRLGRVHEERVFRKRGREIVTNAARRDNAVGKNLPSIINRVAACRVTTFVDHNRGRRRAIIKIVNRAVPFVVVVELRVRKKTLVQYESLVRLHRDLVFKQEFFVWNVGQITRSPRPETFKGFLHLNEFSEAGRVTGALAHCVGVCVPG